MNKPKLIAKSLKPIVSIDSINNIESIYPKLPQEFIDSMAIKVDAFYKKNWANNSMNGSFLVAQNGEVIYERYNGFANKKDQTLITESTPLHIASVSKVLTATAILKLITDKKLELDQKLNTILDTFPFPDVTIRTLLNHRSGLKNYTHFTYDKKIWNYNVVLTNQDILNILAAKKINLEFKTNTHFSYSNTNYALLALVIEKISGTSYADFMKKTFFEPFQMTNSFVFDHNTDSESVTPSYRANNQKYAFEYLDAVYGDKNIYSTPRDLLKFDMARKLPGFLNPDLEAEIYQGYSYESKGTKNYGLGIRMIEWPTGQKFYFHNGWWHGNTSAFISLKNEIVTIICLSNKFSRTTYKVKKVATFFGDYPFKFDEED